MYWRVGVWTHWSCVHFKGAPNSKTEKNKSNRTQNFDVSFSLIYSNSNQLMVPNSIESGFLSQQIGRPKKKERGRARKYFKYLSALQDKWMYDIWLVRGAMWSGGGRECAFYPSTFLPSIKKRWSWNNLPLTDIRYQMAHGSLVKILSESFHRNLFELMNHESFANVKVQF